MGEVRVCYFVPGLPAFRRGNHDAAATKARKVVGDIGPGEAQRFRQSGRVSRSPEDLEEDPRSGWVAHRTTETVHHIQTRRKSQHLVTIHSLMSNRESVAEVLLDLSRVTEPVAGHEENKPSSRHRAGRGPSPARWCGGWLACDRP